VVFDSTILVSAFLTPHGLCDALLRQGRQGEFSLILSDAILAESRDVLVADEALREDYSYSDQDVAAFIHTVRGAATIVRDISPLPGITRDPNDDMIVACATAAEAQYVITRDKDLLTLKIYDDVEMLRPEEFIRILRKKVGR
jgi:putative PIN family toxin of toxin-antitoxin system